MDFKALSKKIILPVVSATVFMVVSVNSVFAWQSYSSTMVSSPVGTGNGDGMVIADNGDVVTTDKWNQLSTYVRNHWYLLTDGMRGKTGLIRGHNSTIGGVTGWVTDELNLPIKGGIGPYGGAIHFKDQDVGYATPGTWYGGIIYGLSRSNSLDLYWFQDGVSITTGPTGNYKAHTLGWERINLYDTASFDPSCQYRFQTSAGAGGRWYNATTVVNSQIHLVEDSDWGDNVFSPVFLKVNYDQKTVLGHDYTNGTYGTPHGAIISVIEKFCLPSYNPNNY